MPESGSSVVRGGRFATFEGCLDRERVRQLFAQRSLSDRALTLVAWSLATAVVVVVTWWMGGRDRLPGSVRWGLSTFLGVGMFGFGLLQQFAAWHARLWLRWNEVLLGPYRTVLTDEYVDMQTTRLALRLPYNALLNTDSGLSCVRVALDAFGCRAVLLPIRDCQPLRTAGEIEAFIRERIRDARTRTAELTHISDRDPPLPFDMADEAPRITFSGPLHQGDLLHAVEADADQIKERRSARHGYILLTIVLVAAAILAAMSVARGRRLDLRLWIAFGSAALCAVLIGTVALRRRRLKAEIEADPEARAGLASGCVSPGGLAVAFGPGQAAATWSGCDVIEISEQQILARFWSKGYIVLIGRHMVRSDADWEQIVRWARQTA